MYGVGQIQVWPPGWNPQMKKSGKRKRGINNIWISPKSDENYKVTDMHNKLLRWFGKWTPKGMALLGSMIFFFWVGEALLEEICHCRSGLWGLVYAQAMPRIQVHYLLSLDHRTHSSSSVTMSACIPPCFWPW